MSIDLRSMYANLDDPRLAVWEASLACPATRPGARPALPNSSGPAWTPAWRRSVRPGAPFQAGFGQGRRLTERGIAGEVQRVQRRMGCEIPRSERGQVPFLLDEPEDGGVVEDLGADVVRSRVRRHNDGGD